MLGSTFLAGGLMAPATAQTLESQYNRGQIPTTVPGLENDADPTGTVSSFQPNGTTQTSTNAFFQSLGTNGRSCVTCHQPPAGMSVNVAGINARYAATNGLDPIFAPVDGADCPASVTSQGQPAGSYSMLLTRGLFRIALTMQAAANFKLTVVSDPLGCNLNNLYNQTVDPITGRTLQVVSVYRRPMVAANLSFVTTSIPIAPSTTPIPAAIMWDGREASLNQQAIDATLGHAQALTAPTTAQVNQIVAFENGIYTAQSIDAVAGKLNSGGATGGPIALSTVAPGQANTRGSVNEFASWSTVTGTSKSVAQKQSILRGQVLFATKTFTDPSVAGLTTVTLTCSGCHVQVGDGNDAHGEHGVLDTGTSGTRPSPGSSSQPIAGVPPLDPTLPIFQIDCDPGQSTQYLGPSVQTNDPGKALTTGLCQDTAKIKVGILRSLAARAPYFHSGSAANLTGVVNFYNSRFNIGFSAQDIQDLTNYLGAL